MADADATQTETTETTTTEQAAEPAEAFAVDESAEATEAEGSAADNTSSEDTAGEAFQSEDDDADASSDADTSSEQEGGDVPDEYEAFEVPEGMQVEEEAMTTFQDRAKADGLTQEQAQKRLDHVAELKQFADNQARQHWTDKATEWSGQSKEAGLLGKETLSMASVGLSKAPGGPEVSKLLSQLGLDKNPAIITAFSELGKKMSPDTDNPRRTEGAAARTDAASAEQADAERKQRMYPNEAKQE